jgi:hypothetical protein
MNIALLFKVELVLASHKWSGVIMRLRNEMERKSVEWNVYLLPVLFNLLVLANE